MIDQSMSNGVSIYNYPLFEKGVFEKHPSLFNVYFRNAPEYSKKKYKEAQKTLCKYERTFTWPLVSGPGFCGATHPGAGKTFNGIMVGTNTPVYNSDCLYINPLKNVFAISDSPGVTTLSRGLFKELDRCLQNKSVYDLETIINNLNRQILLKDQATLTTICFYKDRSSGGFDKALAFIAGDTFLFHGNVFQGKMMQIEDDPNFLGSSIDGFKPVHLDIAEGDFFVIASDGITAIRPARQGVRLDDTILSHVNSDCEGFGFSVIQACNRIIEEQAAFGLRTSFNGGDDISVILVIPEKLDNTVSEDSIILGGYVRD